MARRNMRYAAACIGLVVFMMLISSGCIGTDKDNHHENQLLHSKSTKKSDRKKVILVCVDSLMSQTIELGMKQNRLPTLEHLMEHGQYFKEAVSSFPTMSVTIDSSLMTGTYPGEHRVPGLTWYSQEERRVINYGTGAMEIVQQGVDSVLTEALIHLNGRHLHPQTHTIYELLAKHGLRSGSINGTIYRGATDHTLSIPIWLDAPTSLPKEIKVKGPDFLSLGVLSNPLAKVKRLPDSMFKRLGFNNDFSIETAKYLIENNLLPDFLYIYLPDLDKEAHRKGPYDVESTIRADQHLHTLLDAFGSMEEAANEAVFIIVGDSGVSQILPKDQQPYVHIRDPLSGFNILETGNNVTDETEIVLAVNETMAYIYKLNPFISLRALGNMLKEDERIDFVSWKENEWIHVVQGGASGKEVTFKEGGNLTDIYKQQWTVELDDEVLDLVIDASRGSIEYERYPDALKRLSSAHHSHEGEFLILTVKEGYELLDSSSPAHRGGGHGSLNRMESTVPLFIYGTNERPTHLRLIDIQPFIAKLLTAADFS